MTSAAWPRVSIVINTLNRAATLSTALDSLRWVSYPGEFEVVVVGGPSTDDTDAVLREWSDRVKVESCAAANLSVSRNIGIAASSGEIVAFIDDDAVPEAEWLVELMTAYDDPHVGAAGGYVVNHTGRDYQSTYSTFSRLGDPVDSHGLPASGLAFPYSFTFPHLIGTNASFRRDVLAQVGGFDEEYEYFLDDTDVLVRAMDAGYDIAQVAGAHIHHKFAPSNIRGPARVARNRYSVIKNRTYFSSRHARSYLDPLDLRADQEAFAQRHADELAVAAEQGLVDAQDVAAFAEYRDRAIETGRLAAERNGLLVVGEDWRLRPARGFLPFMTLVPPDEVRRAVLVAAPQNGSDAVAARARELARSGVVPHVVQKTDDPSNIDFRDGVWWHNVHPLRHDWQADADDEVKAILRRFPGATVS